MSQKFRTASPKDPVNAKQRTPAVVYYRVREHSSVVLLESPRLVTARAEKLGGRGANRVPVMRESSQGATLFPIRNDLAFS